MYAITASIQRNGITSAPDCFPYVTTRQIPTFFLDERVQGIVSESHAELIASQIVNAWCDSRDVVSVTAVKL